MTDDARTMIVLDAGKSRFQFRVGALIWSHGHVLIHRNVKDPFWALPGGRVELQESGAETLVREIEEEIGCSATVGPLRLLIENFFELEGRKCQEIGFYYDAELGSPLQFHQSEIVHRCRDGSADLEFRWALPTVTALRTFDLKPAPLISLLENLPDGFKPLVHRDGKV